MLKEKIKGNNNIKKNPINTKKIINIPRLKIYFIIILIIFVVVIQQYLNNKLYSKISFYIVLFISLVMIFTDKYIINQMKDLIEYITASTRELIKIVWPDKKTAMALMIMVVVFVTILSLFILGVDSVVSWLFYDILLKR